MDMKNILGFSLLTWIKASLFIGMVILGLLNSLLNLCEGLFMPCLFWFAIAYVGAYWLSGSKDVKSLMRYMSDLVDEK